MQRLRRFCALILSGIMLFYIACVTAYLIWGWFESPTLGKTQHRKRIYIEGPRFDTRKRLGLFPRAEGLLTAPFSNNAWTIESADGHIIYATKPTWWFTPLAHIPEHVRTALLFAEDRRFYHHPGVDPVALLRAVVMTLKSFGRNFQGGSTIAMQVAKDCLLEFGQQPSHTVIGIVVRKSREGFLALRLTQVEGRDRILAYYLNHAYFGGGAYGIGPAAWDFFRKKPSQLSLGEAAWLIVQLRSPRPDPRHKQWQKTIEVRRRRLLKGMHDKGRINEHVFSQAIRTVHIRSSVLLARRKPSIHAPQTVGAVFHALKPIFRRFDLPVPPDKIRQLAPFPPFPIRIRTSLHARLSWAMYGAAQPVMKHDLKYAMVLLVNGKPVVLLGGEPYLFNFAFQGPRQVGSVSKLFFYDIVWRLKFIHPETIITDNDMDAPRGSRKSYHPRNSDGRLHGQLPSAECFYQSFNKCSYFLWGDLETRDRKKILKMLINDYALPWQNSAQSERQFIKRFVHIESAPLGTWSATPWELTCMLEQGFRGHALELENIIITWNDKPHANVLVGSSPGLSSYMAEASRNAVHATAPQALGHQSQLTIFGKTGTTNRSRNAWFAGFIIPLEELPTQPITPYITFVAWAGYEDNRASNLSGGEVHGPVLRRFLEDEQVSAILRSLAHTPSLSVAKR